MLRANVPASLAELTLKTGTWCELTHKLREATPCSPMAI